VRATSLPPVWSPTGPEPSEPSEPPEPREAPEVPPGSRPTVAVRPLVLRVLVSLGVLALLGWLLDLERVPGMLLQMDPVWILLALVITVLQTTLSAWRWCFTASRLGMHLPLRMALREYYLGAFLNQLLPGGVMGDVTRAWRHSRSGHGAPRPGPAFRAVILERASGQLVMIAVALYSLGMLREIREVVGAGPAGSFAIGPGPLPGSSGLPGLLTAGIAVLAAIMVTAATLRGWRRVRNGPVAGARIAARGAIWTDTREALLSPRALPIQLGSSLLVVASYLTVYLLGARALGIDTPTSLLLPLVAPVLMAMLIPLTMAGWGVREGGAALVWTAAGLPPSEGVAISVTYGLLVLVSTLPGLPILLGVISRNRGRRAGRSPGGSDGSGGGWPRPVSPREPG